MILSFVKDGDRDRDSALLSSIMLMSVRIGVKQMHMMTDDELKE
jgi:hypothetical protein